MCGLPSWVGARNKVNYAFTLLMEGGTGLDKNRRAGIYEPFSLHAEKCMSPTYEE